MSAAKPGGPRKHRPPTPPTRRRSRRLALRPGSRRVEPRRLTRLAEIVREGAYQVYVERLARLMLEAGPRAAAPDDD